MFSAGILVIPNENVNDLLTVVGAAEVAGYDFCLIADEGFTLDVYVLMTLLAARTQHIRMAPITNPYSRHPAVTAAALGSVNLLAPGRIFLSLVPGGSLVLGPMNLSATKAVSACRDAIQIIRGLLSGAKTDVEGQVFGLSGGELHFSAEPIEIWVMGRGPKMVQLSGELADVTVVSGHIGFEQTLEMARAGAKRSGRQLKIAQLSTMAFNQEIMDKSRSQYTYVIPDSPPSAWEEYGVDPEWVAELKKTREQDGIEAATAMITDDILHRSMVAGTPDQCVTDNVALVKKWHHSHFILPVMSLDPAYALPFIREAADIYSRTKQQLEEEHNASEP